jgi:hypothetical protein
MLHHLSGVKSNLALQQAFNKYGKENFQFVIYAYAPNTLPHITDLKTLFMSYFPFSLEAPAEGSEGVDPTEAPAEGSSFCWRPLATTKNPAACIFFFFFTARQHYFIFFL